MDAAYMELSGQLTGIGLRPLVNFLSDLKKSGTLAIKDAGWSGTIGLIDGQIVGANFANEGGLGALDAIFVTLQHGSFEFHTCADCERNVLMPPLALAEHLDTLEAEVQQLADLVSSLSAVPGQAESIPDGEITLTRSSLALLLAIDGFRTVADYARERGLLATLRQVSELIRLELLNLQSPIPDMDATRAPVREIPPPGFRARATPNAARTDGATAAATGVHFFRGA